jgi:DNA-binding NtrC family response regulator
VLVVEDEYDVAEGLRLALEKLDCEVAGPVSTSEDACEIVKGRELDAAVLDIALSPGTSAPVARALRSRGCPFVFVTGYSNLDMLPEELRGHHILLKPVDAESLGAAIMELVDSVESRP